MSGERTAMLRNKVADYIKIGESWELMGTGFTQLNESPGAQSDSTTYINEVTTSTVITGYETEFEYESDMIPSQKAVMALWQVGRDHLTGDAAQFEYVRVELYNPVDGDASSYKARKFMVSDEVSDCEGDGGEKISVSGTLHAMGDPVQGKFNPATKTFDEGTFVGQYDVDLNGGEEEDTSSITLDQTSLTVNKDDVAQITATVEPAGTEVTWTSSNEAAATVDSTGLVTGIDTGRAVITASITVDGNTKSATCVVEVV